jgi:hypothetical protein
MNRGAPTLGDQTVQDLDVGIGIVDAPVDGDRQRPSPPKRERMNRRDEPYGSTPSMSDGVVTVQWWL